MRINRKSASLVAAVVGALILALTQPSIAEAAAKATAGNTTLSVSTGRLIVFAGDTSTASSPSTVYTTSGVTIPKSTPKTFYIRNTGNFATSAFTFTITLDSGAKIASLYRCNLGQFFGTTLKKCGPTNVSGTQLGAVNMNSPYTSTLTLSLPVGGFYAFQIDVSANCKMTASVSANTANVTGSVISS